jgi:hypothetical protein
MYALAVRIEPILATPAMRARICDDCRRYFDFVRSMRAVMEPDGTRIKRDEAKIVREMEPSTHYIGAFMKMLEIRNRNQVYTYSSLYCRSSSSTAVPSYRVHGARAWTRRHLLALRDRQILYP